MTKHLNLEDRQKNVCVNTLGASNKNAYKTAISRKILSKPMRKMQSINLLWQKGQMLDYGCGRGQDADKLNMKKYDPHYFPKRPKKTFNLITCNYVLNVIPSDSDKLLVLKDIQSLLSDHGVAYITVRRDIKSEGLTSRKTWQETVRLRLCSVLYFQGQYETYVLDKHCDVTDLIYQENEVKND